MSDIKDFVHEFEEIKAPEQWKNDVKNISVDYKIMNNNMKIHYRKLVLKISIILTLIIIVSIGGIRVAAANIPSFRAFIEDIFGSNEDSIKVTLQEQIPKVGAYDVDSSFLIINKDSSNQIIYALQNGSLKEVTPKRCEGYVYYDNKKYIFAFQYAINGDEVYGFSYEGVAVGLVSHPGAINSAIVMFSIDDKFEDAWYIDLLTGELSPLVNREDAEELFHRKAIHSIVAVDGVESWDARKTYATEIKPSPNGDYILFQSNRDDLVSEPLTKDSELKQNSKLRHWFLHDNNTNEEIRLDFIDWSLSVGYIFWIDDETIAVLNYDDEKEEWWPILYNAKAKEQQILGPVKGGDHKYTLIFDERTDTQLIIHDLLHDKTIPFSLEETDSNVTYFSNSNLQFFRKDGSILFYDLVEGKKRIINQSKNFDIGQKSGEYVDFIHELDTDTLLLISVLNVDQHQYYLISYE
ncbi:hypothetical protein [Clostridium sp. Marseille-P299]|uniref:hypothetical protein n=1 Tax=Clostridium sp. Marseille-P299 TaxID=1805477 RepID=UPI00082F0E9C|nr:hypothetical protein [Clostridium sp. Marseille-P299]